MISKLNFYLCRLVLMIARECFWQMEMVQMWPLLLKYDTTRATSSRIFSSTARPRSAASARRWGVLGYTFRLCYLFCTFLYTHVVWRPLLNIGEEIQYLTAADSITKQHTSFIYNPLPALLDKPLHDIRFICYQNM